MLVQLADVMLIKAYSGSSQIEPKLRNLRSLSLWPYSYAIWALKDARRISVFALQSLLLVFVAR